MRAAALLLLLPGAASAVEATLSLLNGQSVRGELASFDSASVQLLIKGELRTYPAKEVHSLALPTPAKSRVDYTTGQLELTTGTSLPVREATIRDGQFQFMLAPPFSAAGSQLASLPQGLVSSIVFEKQSVALHDAWRSQKSNAGTADLIVVKRKEGKSLDYLNGLVDSVSTDTISLQIDGESLTAPRRRVYGIVVFHPDQSTATAQNHIGIITPFGEVWAQRVSYQHNRVEAALADDVEVTLPIKSVSSVDYSRGKLFWLSDLPARGVKWTPLFPPPGDASLAQEWGKMRINESYSGDKLTARDSKGRLITYSKGIALRSRGEATFRKPPGATKLIASVAIDPAPGVGGAVELTIEGDGRSLFSKPIDRNSGILDLDLPVADVTDLRILVDYGPLGDTGDNLHFGNARFTK